MRLSIVVLITALLVGGTVIFLGFLTSSEYLDVPEISNHYEKLETYKNKLEKINHHNQQVLFDLEEQINNSDDIPISEIQEEIKMIKQVIDENKAELEKVITKLSQMESDQ